MALTTLRLLHPSRYLFTNFNSVLIKHGRALADEKSTNLKDVLASLIPEQRETHQKIKACLGDKVIGEIKINNIMSGMRGLHLIMYDTSVVDPKKGVMFRGKSLEECRECLPKAKDSHEILPESLFWLLVTGKIPTEEQAKCLGEDWRKRAKLPKHVETLLNTMPNNLHPMVQLSIAVLALSTEGIFMTKYKQGIKKTDHWMYIFEDAMNLIANVPYIAAHIYNNTFQSGKEKDKVCISDLDWAANYARMIGLDGPLCFDMMRLQLSIHCDNEGGNVSAHAVQLVGSALSCVYLSYSAGMNGLAGPLHGLANQDVLIWLTNMKKEIGDCPSKEDIGKYIRKTIGGGQVLPGYGHAVLRVTDNRFTAMLNFGKKHFPDDPMFKLAMDVFEVAPPILKESKKISNPWPNVDAISGSVLQHFGVKEISYYTVIFAVSRCLGTMAALIWARALGSPIERPRSASSEHFIQMALANKPSGK